MPALVNGGGTFHSATGGTSQSDTDGTFHSDIPGTFESDMGGTFKLMQSTDRRVWISDKNKFVWFERWIRGKQSICDFAHESGYSERTLKRYFYRLLPRCSLWQIQRREKVNLLIDGTYISNKICLVVYRDHNIKMILLYRITKSETLRDLRADLKAIRDVGIQIESVTCDEAPNIIKAVREVCPEAIVQRCTVHVTREIETWITRKPQTAAAQELLDLVRLLNGVQTQEEA